jgi:hypothetical protein
MERFVRGPKVDEVARGTGKLFFGEGVPVAVLNAGGAFYAVEDACPLMARVYRMGLSLEALSSAWATTLNFFRRPANVSRSGRKGSEDLQGTS